MPLAQLLNDIDLTAASAESAGANVEHMLTAIRSHLNMDVAFASNVTDTETIIRYVDACEHAPFGAGDAFPVDDGYCKRILDGRLPPLIHDASTIPEAARLPCTKEMPIGAHISVPLILSDGSVYGTFCCFSFQPDHSFTERDVAMMRAFADLAAGQIETALTLCSRRASALERISEVIDRDSVAIVYQPIYSLAANDVVGVEALSRFPDSEIRSPERWFAEAADVGLGSALELVAIRSALRGLEQLPKDVYLAINVSPEVLLSGKVERLLKNVPPGRVVLEVTEHAVIKDFVDFRRVLGRLRGRVKIAVDDAGAGYSGLRHILDIQPDIIKLDMTLTRGINKDPARAALASALITFSSQTNSQIVAEGVETAGELATLKDLGTACAQGYYLHRPKPLPALVQLLVARSLGPSVGLRRQGADCPQGLVPPLYNQRW